MTRPDVVFFDLDDTLYDQAAPFAHAVHKMLGTIPGASDAALFEASRRHSTDIFAALSSGQRPTDAMYVRRMQETLADFDVSISTTTARKLQQTYSSKDEHAMALFPGMKDCLELCARYARIGIISNGREGRQLSKLEELDMWSWITRDEVFISESLGMAKPDPAIFRYACSRMGTTCERCLFVGDAWAIDVVGARRAHMPVAWFNHRHRARPDDPAPDWTIETTRELHTLLCRLFEK